MNSIQDFIQNAASQIGADRGQTESGTAAILELVRGQAESGDFQSLIDAIPGAGALLDKPAPGGGGLLGGASGMLSGALGGKLGGAASLIGVSGLDTGQAGKLVEMFVSFAKSQAGEAVIGRILESVPELQTFLR